MVFTNSSLQRLRRLNANYSHQWQESNDVNDAADEIINTPEKYLLT